MVKFLNSLLFQNAEIYTRLGENYIDNNYIIDITLCSTKDSIIFLQAIMNNLKQVVPVEITEFSLTMKKSSLVLLKGFKRDKHLDQSFLNFKRERPEVFYDKRVLKIFAK